MNFRRYNNPGVAFYCSKKRRYVKTINKNYGKEKKQFLPAG